LRGSFIEQTIFIASLRKGWRKIRPFTTIWGRVK
jgi:hypothetical protein